MVWKIGIIHKNSVNSPIPLPLFPQPKPSVSIATEREGTLSELTRVTALLPARTGSHPTRYHQATPAREDGVLAEGVGLPVASL
ncbi:MAG TPA: hypothetical protein DDW68_13570 [Verrucomicrobiales bacterium]|nr:hypothetical protein [Verrucomicrobiales bacterium]HBE98191.1 hypothetical protein [Verrucomicrobiales bacterium]